MQLKGYRDHIIKRDGGRCFLCWTKKGLHIHHIKTRGAGGTDEYSNLLTLCWRDHTEKAHGLEAKRYKAIFFDYTKNFERPSNWDQVMEVSKDLKQENLEKMREYRRQQYQRQKEYKAKLSAESKGIQEDL